MSEFLEQAEAVARKAAEEASKVILKNFRTSLSEVKGGNIRDVVTNADKEADAIIREIVSKNFPTHSIITEENEPRKGTSYEWHIDPIDGSVNYSRGSSYFCTSIALARGNEVLLGIVYAPVSKEFYVAVKGKGAYLGEKRLAVSKIETCEQAILCTDFGYKNEERQFIMDFLKDYSLKLKAIRMRASGVLQVCELARGSVDCYLYPKSTSWDYAASALILREAGGIVTDFRGLPWQPTSKNVLAAATMPLHTELLKAVEKA